MARNGSGVFSLALPGNPVVTGTTISSVVQNNTMSDVALALTQSLAYDGQTNPVANLPMATFRHTGVGNAVNLTDYISATDAQKGTPTFLTNVAGADTITATAPYSMAAYTAGQTLRFISAGANTGAVTLNVNGIGAIAVTKLGASPMVAGDISAGQAVEVILDGVRAQMVAPSVNALPYTQIFTGSGTFTMPAGYRGLLVECIAGGGGGGSGRRGAAGSLRLGGWGGGGGARTRAFITSVATGAVITVTVGAGGTAGAAQTTNGTDGNVGTSGGNSSFGAYLTAYGGCFGAGGIAQASGAPSVHSSGGGGSGGQGVPGMGGPPANNFFGFEVTNGDASTNNNVGGGGAAGSDRNAPGCSEWGGAAGGGSVTTATAFAGGGAVYGGCGGGGGGGIDASNVNRAGGAGGTNGYAVGGGAAANASGADGTGTLAGGGGGGGTPVAGVGSPGGAGGAIGGGGGGGSASVDGNASGAGGAGGRGEVRVWAIS